MAGRVIDWAGCSIKVVVVVALVDGPGRPVSGLLDLEDRGILFLLRICIITMQMMSITMTIIADSSAAKKSIWGGVDGDKSDFKTELD